MSNDRTYQIEELNKLYEDGRCSPIFRANPRYPTPACPRIAYDDVMNYQYVIRAGDGAFGSPFWSEETEVLARYTSVEALVDDGWRLD
jgi:hypothetical protein